MTRFVFSFLPPSTHLPEGNEGVAAAAAVPRLLLGYGDGDELGAAAARRLPLGHGDCDEIEAAAATRRLLLIGYNDDDGNSSSSTMAAAVRILIRRRGGGSSSSSRTLLLLLRQHDGCRSDTTTTAVGSSSSTPLLLLIYDAGEEVATAAAARPLLPLVYGHDDNDEEGGAMAARRPLPLVCEYGDEEVGVAAVRPLLLLLYGYGDRRGGGSSSSHTTVAAARIRRRRQGGRSSSSSAQCCCSYTVTTKTSSSNGSTSTMAAAGIRRRRQGGSGGGSDTTTKEENEDEQQQERRRRFRAQRQQAKMKLSSKDILVNPSVPAPREARKGCLTAAPPQIGTSSTAILINPPVPALPEARKWWGQFRWVVCEDGGCVFLLVLRSSRCIAASSSLYGHPQRCGIVLVAPVVASSMHQRGDAVMAESASWHRRCCTHGIMALWPRPLLVYPQRRGSGRCWVTEMAQRMGLAGGTSEGESDGGGWWWAVVGVGWEGWMWTSGGCSLIAGVLAANLAFVVLDVRRSWSHLACSRMPSVTIGHAGWARSQSARLRRSSSPAVVLVKGPAVMVVLLLEWGSRWAALGQTRMKEETSSSPLSACKWKGEWWGGEGGIIEHVTYATRSATHLVGFPLPGTPLAFPDPSPPIQILREQAYIPRRAEELDRSCGTVPVWVGKR
ncbi:hypothetical protein BDZ97DRAFT_1766586 [Flammula alnicola]|nr:hypothetical protein BDZ97DRAFT_1766586 [Flammula alnicola]